MIKIIAKSKYAYNKREIIDRTLDPVEAEQLVEGYRTAFGPEWTIETLATKRQRDFEQVADLRRQGKRLSEIMDLTGFDAFKVLACTSALGQAGLIEKRKSGNPGEKKAERNDRIVELRKAGKSGKEIAAELGMNYYSVRAMLYALRKRGRFDD